MLIKYWKQIAFITIIGTLCALIAYMDFKIKVLNAEKAQYKYALDFQNEAIEANRAEYDKAVKVLPTILYKIDTRYKTEKISVIQWRDNNETNDCNGSLDYLNRFKF